MGGRGPTPKPPHLKALEGNPGKRPLNNTAKPLASRRGQKAQRTTRQGYVHVARSP